MRFAVTAALLALMAQAPAQAAGYDQALPSSLAFSAENLRLPGHETLGLVGSGLLLEARPGWWLGPAVYGAARGERGGLFVGGAELRRRWVWGQEQIQAGLFAGGGGGAAAPVGGGLMLRPSISALHDFGGWQAGLSWSSVRFPSGLIRSNPWGLALAIDGDFRFASDDRVGQRLQDNARSGVGFDHFVGTATTYRWHEGSGRSHRIGLVGARLAQQRSGGWSTSLEAAGAATGGAAGYMQVMGGLAWQAPLLPTLAPGVQAGVRGAVGLGGGGAVPTGGGLIATGTLTLQAALSPTLSTGVEWGALRAGSTALRAPVLQWWLSAALEPGRNATTSAPSEGTVARTEWVASVQHYQHAQRQDGSSRALDTVGLKINRQIDEHLYLSGQAHSAMAGGAGAYSVGLVGAGLATATRRQGWQAGVEALVGASGGGGVATQGGALLQGLAWAGWHSSPSSQWRAGLGTLRSARGGLSTPMAELAWCWSFGQVAP
jgi:hypothetical protein